VPRLAETHALFAMAASSDCDVHHLDVKTAILNAKMEEKMYNKLPEGTVKEEADTVGRLNQALYGTKHAGCFWGIKLDIELNSMGAGRLKV